MHQMAKATNAPDRPVCIATVFGKDEVEVTRSFLRAYGIITLDSPAGSYRDEQWPRGTGASPILVPASQARDAIDLLRSTEDEGADETEEPEKAADNPQPGTGDAGFVKRWWALLTAPFRSTDDVVATVRKRIIHDLPPDHGEGGSA